MPSNAIKEKKSIQFNTIVIVFILAVIVALLSYVIPAGQFAREVVDGRSLVVPGSFQFMESTPITFWQFWTDIPKAWTNGAGNIWMILIVSAMVAVLEATGTLDAFLTKSLSSLKGKEELMIILIGTFFSILGATGTFLTPIIAVLPIGVKAAKKMGYDGVVGFMLTYAATAAGFDAGVINIYSTSIGQSIAGLPQFSGLGWRVLEHVVFLAITLIATILYGPRVKADPSKSLIPGHVREDLSDEHPEEVKLTARQIIVGLITLAGFGVMIYGSLAHKWGNNQISALFFMLAIIIGLVGGLGPNKTADVFSAGIKNTAVIAVIIGMSQLISVLMTDANIMDTVVYYVSMPIMSMGPILGIFALFVFNLIFNFFIPSATAQCYVVMPIQIGIADLAGINPQVAIEAYKLGDAITNMTWPTVPTFMACLAMLNIPYDKWLKWSFKWLICGLGGAGAIIMILWQLIG